MRILGGPLVWHNMRFTANLLNLPPHYQLTLRFKLIIGEASDDFFALVDGQNMF